MSETAEKTVGKTTKKEATPSPISVVETVVRILKSVGANFKRVGGDFVSDSDLKKFISTLLALGNLGPYDVSLTVDTISYPLTDFKIDSRIAKAFLLPRQIVMAEVSPYRKDVRVHPDVKAEWNPAQMIEFQYRFLGMFKVQPTFTEVTEFVASKPLGEVSEVMRAEYCHVEDLAAVKSLPIELKITDELWAQEYFNVPFSKVVEMICVNLMSALVSNQN